MNYYLTGIEGMPKLLDACNNPLQYFKKNIYPKEFQRLYQENFQTFDAIENCYNTVIDKEQCLANMAEALVSHGAERMNACKKRGARDRMMMDLNMAMAVFVFPMILEYKGNSSRPLVDKLMEAWKREFPKSEIKPAEYDFIEQGFHKKFCYITSAVCESFGKPDDCYELTLLRDYRDNYLASSIDGEAMISEYYDVAPSIVKHIDMRENSREIYRGIWDEYLAPCISMIEQEQMESCRDLYREMVYTLKDKYFKI